MKKVTVMWVGLSAKKAAGTEECAPLHESTNTGKLVAEIEAQCRRIRFYKTNLVKFPPLDSNGKLRYPTTEECMLSYPELQIELQSVNPRVVLLLGNQTAAFVFRQLGLQMCRLSSKYEAVEYDKKWYVPIHHPSYIMVYKRTKKAQYIRKVKAAIEQFVV